MTLEAFRDRGWHEPADSIFERPEWHQQAACRGAGPDAFFPRDSATAPKVIAKAQSVCRRCPVRAECAAAGEGEHYGIWNGEARYGYPSRRQRAS